MDCVFCNYNAADVDDLKSHLVSCAYVNQNSDLRLASSEELATELMNRYDNIIIACDKLSREENKKVFKTRFKGSQIRCMGLATILQHELFAALNENSGPLDAAEEE